jgi:hypothetical protein
MLYDEISIKSSIVIPKWKQFSLKLRWLPHSCEALKLVRSRIEKNLMKSEASQEWGNTTTLFQKSNSRAPCFRNRHKLDSHHHPLPKDERHPSNHPRESSGPLGTSSRGSASAARRWPTKLQRASSTTESPREEIVSAIAEPDTPHRQSTISDARSNTVGSRASAGTERMQAPSRYASQLIGWGMAAAAAGSRRGCRAHVQDRKYPPPVGPDPADFPAA